ncbi:MAG: hypothetical protein MMC23_005588 [Stictis urceolatum]|nr:hypothetical protein [Stictis urceolata]
MAETRIKNTTVSEGVDVVIKATEKDLTRRTATPTTNISRQTSASTPSRLERFGASADVLTKSSPEFARILSVGLGQAQLTEVMIDVDSLAACELWMRRLHSYDGARRQDLSVNDVWAWIAFADDFGLDLSMLASWFEEWHAANCVKVDPRQLLFPALKFNNAETFGQVTQALVYGGQGHVTEDSPLPYREHHVPSRVMDE